RAIEVIAMSLLLALALELQQSESAPQTAPVSAAEAALSDAAVRAAITRGAAFLVESQNADGSWGGARNKMMTDSFANVATYEAWTEATTGLCCVALLELGQTQQAQAACDKGLDYVCAHADVKRPADWDTDNTWGL